MSHQKQLIHFKFKSIATFLSCCFGRIIEQIVRSSSKFFSNEQSIAGKLFVVVLDAFLFNR